MKFGSELEEKQVEGDGVSLSRWSAIGFAALLVSLPAWNKSAAAAEPELTALTIKIENVSNEGGCVRVALFDRNNYDGHDQEPVASACGEAIAPETLITLTNLPMGIYAVKAFQDFNRTNSFVTSALGLPEEPYGFSNDARPLFDQPSFDSAKFELTPKSNEIVVHLQPAF